jgi:hypothetical protein
MLEELWKASPSRHDLGEIRVILDSDSAHQTRIYLAFRTVVAVYQNCFLLFSRNALKGPCTRFCCGIAVVL